MANCAQDRAQQAVPPKSKGRLSTPFRPLPGPTEDRGIGTWPSLRSTPANGCSGCGKPTIAEATMNGEFRRHRSLALASIADHLQRAHSSSTESASLWVRFDGTLFNTRPWYGVGHECRPLGLRKFALRHGTGGSGRRHSAASGNDGRTIQVRIRAYIESRRCSGRDGLIVGIRPSRPLY